MTFRRAAIVSGARPLQGVAAGRLRGRAELNRWGRPRHRRGQRRLGCQSASVRHRRLALSAAAPEQFSRRRARESGPDRQGQRPEILPVSDGSVYEDRCRARELVSYREQLTNQGNRSRFGHCYDDYGPRDLLIDARMHREVIVLTASCCQCASGDAATGYEG